MKKGLLIFIIFILAVSASGIGALFPSSPVSAADTNISASKPGNYVTRRELARKIAEATGEDPDRISEFMFSKGLDENATMADVVEILFQSNMMKKTVNEEKTFLGKPILRVYK